MRPRSQPLGYEALNPADFAGLGQDDAELFLRELVVHELTERHADGWTINGPQPPNVGGTDLRVAVRAAPRVDRSAYAEEHHVDPLTFDEPGPPTVYSVKSGVTGKQHALDEAVKGSSWAVAALEAGGHFVLVLTRITKDDAPKKQPKAPKKPTAKNKKVAAAKTSATPKEPFTSKLKSAYRDRLRATDPNADDPSDRIHVVDCNDLWTYLRGARPAVSRVYLQKLGIPIIPGLLDLEQWRNHHQGDRPPAPEFVWDSARRNIKDQIVATLKEPAPRAAKIWIVSPPGVGKTRVVLEAIGSEPTLRARTYVVISPSYAVAALVEQDLLAQFRDVILVADDCEEDDVLEIDRAFNRLNGGGAAGLVLITPRAVNSLTAQAPKGLAALVVPPMDDGSSRALIAAEGGFDPTDTRVAEIAEQTQGYAWFNALVARSVGADPARPAPSTVAEAVDLALVLRPTATFDRDVKRRTAALMVVMLADGEDLDSLLEADSAEFVALFNRFFIGWSDLREGIEECARRGLLRAGEGGVFRYVTPAVLELEIARRFLSPSGPGGGGSLRDRAQSHRMRQRFTRLLERLEQLGFAEQDLEALAAPIVEHLTGRPHGVERVAAVQENELLFAARHAPARVAQALWMHVDATPLEALRARTIGRRSLMFALEELAGRRDGFDDAEAALFRLACAENERYANNATAIWTGLFDIALNQTYRTFDERFTLLQSRLTTDDEGGRLVALGAVGRLLRTNVVKRLAEPRDGPYPSVTIGEARHDLARVWQLLGRIMQEGDEVIVAEAAKIAARELRGAIRAGVLRDAASCVARSLDRLAEPQLRHIREEIDRAEVYDRSSIDQQGAAEAWAELQNALGPASFRDRLRQRVGVVVPVALRDDPIVDHTLAQEALSHRQELLGELDWLASPDAVRSLPFAIALGQADERGELVDEVLARAKTSPDLVSGYLRGHVDAGRREVVDDAIAKMGADPELADAAAAAIWRTGANPQRLEWLVEAAGAGRLQERTLGFFAYGGWHFGLDEAELESFARAMLSTGTATGVLVALDALSRGHERRVVAHARLLPLLREALERMGPASVTGHTADIWARAASALVASGDPGEAARLAIGLSMAQDLGLPHPEVLEVLKKAALASPSAAWAALRTALEGRTADARRAAYAAREADLGSILPTKVLRTWAGGDVARGALVADMVSMHDGADFPQLARELVNRFGPDSRIADVLASELQTTPHAVGSLAKFAEETMERVERWTKDPDEAVRKFATAMLGDLRRRRDWYAAREENDRRRHGT